MSTTEIPAQTALYPPEHHMLRDLRFCCYAAGESSIVRAPIVPEVSSLAHTGASAGFIATLVDVYAARCGTHIASPDFVATTALSFQLSRPLQATVAVVQGRVLRLGSRSLVIAVDIYEESNSKENSGGTNRSEIIGQALVSFARLPPRDANAPVYPSYDADNIVDLALPTSGLSIPFLQYLGVQVMDAGNGVLSVGVSEHNTNRLNALQGGATAWLIEASAEYWLQAQSVTTRWHAHDLSVEFIRMGKVGPVQTHATCVRHTAEHAVLRVTVHDTGADNCLMAVGTVTLRNMQLA